MFTKSVIHDKNKDIVIAMRLWPFICIFTFLMLTIVFSPTQSDAKSNKRPNRYAAFIMDADTGLILHQENANKQLHPASLTKIMTLLMTFDAIDQGKMRLNDRVYISKHAANMIPSKIGLQPGGSMPVKDAIYALTTKSANDIAVALGEKIGGSESNFAIMMTKKAHALGMTNTRFMNASGLHDPKQVSTARDMARLARVLTSQYSKHYHYFSAKSFTYQGKTYASHNKLMNSYAGMDGLKTGYIKESGFNLVASAVRNNRRLIGVVFGGETSKSRNDRMERLLNNAFSKIGSQPLMASNTNTDTVPVPQKKPTASIELAGISYVPPSERNTEPSAEEYNKNRWAMLNSTDDSSMFNRMIGQGDYDIDVRNRIETGLIAASAHTGQSIPSYIFADKSLKPSMTLASYTPPTSPQAGNWAIQVGAFSTRDRANKAIASGLQQLPSDLKHGEGIIAPLQTDQGWIFRSRLQGYSEAAAQDACRILNDCIPIYVEN